MTKLPLGMVQALRLLAKMPNTSQDDIDTLLVTLLEEKKVPVGGGNLKKTNPEVWEKRKFVPQSGSNVMLTDDLAGCFFYLSLSIASAT